MALPTAPMVVTPSAKPRYRIAMMDKLSLPASTGILKVAAMKNDSENVALPKDEERRKGLYHVKVFGRMPDAKKIDWFDAIDHTVIGEWTVFKEADGTIHSIRTDDIGEVIEEPIE
jgi:hypothetical protein